MKVRCRNSDKTCLRVRDAKPEVLGVELVGDDEGVQRRVGGRVHERDVLDRAWQARLNVEKDTVQTEQHSVQHI